MTNEPAKIEVDFNSRTPLGNIVLNAGTVREIERMVTGSLKAGIPLVLYDDEFEVDAVLEYDMQFNMWTGIPNWYTKRDHLSFGDSEFNAAHDH